MRVLALLLFQLIRRPLAGTLHAREAFDIEFSMPLGELRSREGAADALREHARYVPTGFASEVCAAADALISRLEASAGDGIDATDRDGVLRITATESRPCPRFHVDNCVARLLSAYSGEGTVVLPDEAVDWGAFEELRAASLSNAEFNRRLERRTAWGARRLVQAGLGDFLILDGRSEATGRRGTVHRSPQKGARSLLLRDLRTVMSLTVEG